MFRVHILSIKTGEIVKTVGEAETLREAKRIEDEANINLDYSNYYTEIEAVVVKK